MNCKIQDINKITIKFSSFHYSSNDPSSIGNKDYILPKSKAKTNLLENGRPFCTIDSIYNKSVNKCSFDVLYKQNDITSHPKFQISIILSSCTERVSQMSSDVVSSHVPRNDCAHRRRASARPMSSRTWPALRTRWPALGSKTRLWNVRRRLYLQIRLNVPRHNLC